MHLFRWAKVGLEHIFLSPCINGMCDQLIVVNVILVSAEVCVGERDSIVRSAVQINWDSLELIACKDRKYPDPAECNLAPLEAVHGGVPLLDYIEQECLYKAKSEADLRILHQQIHVMQGDLLKLTVIDLADQTTDVTTRDCWPRLVKNEHMSPGSYRALAEEDRFRRQDSGQDLAKKANLLSDFLSWLSQ